MWDWWIADDGENWLKGDPDDPSNPVRLRDEMIQMLLTTQPDARESFNYFYPLMLPGEQVRLLRLIQGLPQFVALDPLRVTDTFQHVFNTSTVRTSGPRGGGGWAPPPFKP